MFVHLNIMFNWYYCQKSLKCCFIMCYSFHGDERIKPQSKSTRCFSPRTKRQLHLLFHCPSLQSTLRCPKTNILFTKYNIQNTIYKCFHWLFTIQCLHGPFHSLNLVTFGFMVACKMFKIIRFHFQKFTVFVFKR